MNSKYKILASNTAIFAIGNILVKLIAFFLMPLYTSVLTTAQYGVAELLNNTIEIVLPLASLCIVEALYRFSIDEDANHSALLVNSLCIMLIGDIVVGIGSFVWFYVVGYDYALHFLLLFVATSFYKVTTQFARGLGHVKRYALYGVLNSLLLVFSNIILLVWFKGGIAAYLTSFSIGYGVSGLIAFIISKEFKHFGFRQFDRALLEEMLKYSIPSIPNMLSWWVNSLSDRYIVLFFWGSGITGLYTAASKLPAMINLVTSIFQQAWQYSTAIEINSKDNKSFFSNILRGYTYVCVLVCGGLLIVNKLLCMILLRADFYDAWKYVPLLLLAATFGCITTYFGTFYNALKSNKMLMISTLIGAVSNVVLNFILIPVLGGIGAAIATVVSYFVVMIIRIVNVRRLIEIDLNKTKFIFQLSLLTLSAIMACLSGAIPIIITVLSFAALVISDYRLLFTLGKYLQKKRENCKHV
ncbi:polysaccharide biosynthesis C-terminal domain-containing protein [uncultured Ruminococcus sp.]|uniref:lipopolysaccharide biosynthesis protein n=1 Tax=uncultured Ruminococcus sp. TaxID=165186 RepID=UPI0025FF5FB0|nr:polysaccharide biosynthesis C-terminal domain-containing protein [uncultured Ruminococcus sp.]